MSIALGRLTLNSRLRDPKTPFANTSSASALDECSSSTLPSIVWTIALTSVCRQTECEPSTSTRCPCHSLIRLLISTPVNPRQTWCVDGSIICVGDNGLVVMPTKKSVGCAQTLTDQIVADQISD